MLNMAMNNKSKLRHLAIIPDGNRRWAKKRGLPSWKGHDEGSKKIEEIIKEAAGLGIEYLTFWIASRDNLAKRSKSEVGFLYELFQKAFDSLLQNKKIYEEDVKIRIIGFWKNSVPKKLENSILRLMEATKDHKSKHLSFLFDYDGLSEMIEGVKLIIKNGQSEINYDTIQQKLITSELPPVDLVIRTGGEPHNSAGFMMWHTAYSQYCFTPTLFPSFGKKELNKAVKDYHNRDRRFGA